MIKSLARTCILAFVLALFAVLSNPQSLFAISPEQRSLFDAGILYYNIDEVDSPSCSAAGGVAGGDTDPLLGLAFPTFSNEASIVDGIERVIAERYPESNWIGLGQWIVDESRKNNVNPLLIVSTGGTESGFGDSRIGRELNNYYGVKSGDDYRSFSSPQEGILYLIEGMPEFLAGTRAFGLYKDVTNLYEYSSVHQTGQIVYPYNDFDPEDRDEKPGNTADLWDPAMGVYISWDEEANNRPDVNPTYKGGVYNPLSYYSSNIGFINDITGSSFPDIPGGAGGGSCGGLVAGEYGWDLPGEGTNPMVLYSQRSSGDDPAVQGYYGDEPYGPGPISSCGCGPTSWAMIVSTLTPNKVTPPEVAEWASNNGFQEPPDAGPCGGSFWWWANNPAVSEERWEVTAEAITLTEVPEALRSGSLIMMSVGEGPFTSGGHLLVIRAFTEDGKFLFADPNDYNDTREVAQAVFNGESKNRTPLSAEQFSGSIQGLWKVTAL